MCNGGKKGKGLVREHVWVVQGQGPRCGDWLWAWGWARCRRTKGENWDNCNRITIQNKVKWSPGCHLTSPYTSVAVWRLHFRELCWTHFLCSTLLLEYIFHVLAFSCSLSLHPSQLNLVNSVAGSVGGDNGQIQIFLQSMCGPVEV